jgi:aspartate 1-decarboxylase
MGLMTAEEIQRLKPQVVFVDDHNRLLRVEEHDIVIQNQQ